MTKDQLKEEVFDIIASFLNDINVPESAIRRIQGSYNDDACEILATLDGRVIEANFPGITIDDINEIGKDVLANVKTDSGINVCAKLTLTSQIKQDVWPVKPTEAQPTTLSGPPAAPDIDESTIGNGAMMHGAACPQCGNKMDMTAASKEGRIKCAKCGCVFSPKAFSLSTAPSTEQYTTPYESDVNVTAQLDAMEDPEEPLRQRLRDMGYPEDKIEEVLQLVKETGPNGTQQPSQPVNENTTNQNTMKQMNQIGKHAWFDEPSNREPGGSPYPGSQTFAEAKKETKKDKEEKKRKPNKNEENELFEVITVLDGVDILPLLEDDELIAELLAQFPILGREDIDIDSLIVQGQVHKTPVTDSDPSAGQFSAIDDAGDISDEVVHTDEDELELPEQEDPTNITEELAKEVGEEIGINWDEVEFEPIDLAVGIEIEFEHGTRDPETDVTGDDLIATAKIALAHLNEFADYYVRLVEMEEEAKKALGEVDDADDDAGDTEEGDSDESESSEGKTKGFDAGFPVSGAAYIPICENCGTMQPSPISGPPKPCPICKAPLRSLEERDPERYEELLQQYPNMRIKKKPERVFTPPKPGEEYADDLDEEASVSREGQSKPRPYMLSPREKAEINSKLREAGVDGNGRFTYATSTFTPIAEVLAQYGLLADFGSGDSYGMRRAQSGDTTFNLLRKLDDYDKTDQAIAIDNSQLFVQWYYFNNEDPEAAAFGDAEVIAYLS